ILLIILVLFIAFQLKISKYTYYSNPALMSTKVQKQSTP
ncbi:hypothetical protein DBR06_SOUSAS33610005, partial [Sousa chinensis]